LQLKTRHVVKWTCVWHAKQVEMDRQNAQLREICFMKC